VFSLDDVPDPARAQRGPRASASGRAPGPGQAKLGATKPNQCWSWDITKPHGPAKWSYYYLYVIIDIYSRYVAGWLLAHAESKVLAERMSLRHHCPQRQDHWR
jgi:transposase InsO family protein